MFDSTQLIPQFGKYSIVRIFHGYQLPKKISYMKIYYSDYFITTIIHIIIHIRYSYIFYIPVVQILESTCMPIVFHLARISLLFRRENLQAIKGKAVSSRDTTSCENSQFTSWCHSFEKMNMLFNYIVPKDGLPNPRGSLCSAINSLAISSNSRAVEAELAILQKLTAKRKVRAPYNRWHSLVMRSINFLHMVISCVDPSYQVFYISTCKIGKYASIHGVAAAARHFSRKLQKQIGETTVRSIRNTFHEESRELRYLGTDEDMETMPEKKEGERFYLVSNLMKNCSCI